MPSNPKPIAFSSLWLLYFLLSIGVIGFLLGYLICIPLYIVGRVWKPSQDAADRVLRSGIALLMRVQPWFEANIDLPLQTVGRRPAQLTVSNHRSHLEAFILLSHIEGIRILAKRALFSVPFLGIMMRATKQIPVSRGSFDAFFRAMDEVKLRLEKGERVHVFPEMTRADRGATGLRNFSTAPFRAAIHARATVQPIAFLGTDDVWPKGIFGLSYRLRFAAKNSTAPTASAPIPTSGGTGTLWCLLRSTCSGPMSTAFLWVVYVNPP